MSESEMTLTIIGIAATCAAVFLGFIMWHLGDIAISLRVLSGR